MEKFSTQVFCFRFIPLTHCCVFSDWLHGIGWALTLLSLVQIPLWMLVTIVAAAVQGDVMEAFRPSLVGIPQFNSNDCFSLQLKYCFCRNGRRDGTRGT